MLLFIQPNKLLDKIKLLDYDLKESAEEGTSHEALLFELGLLIITGAVLFACYKWIWLSYAKSVSIFWF